MRHATWAALIAGLAAAGLNAASATEMPAHWMNPHCPFIIHNCYWHPGGYGIWGPTDIVYPHLQPVNHIGPPPFGPRCWYQKPPCEGPVCEGGVCRPGQPAAPGQAPAAAPPQGKWFRSPRDYFMSPY